MSAQNEIPASTIHAHHAQDLGATDSRSRRSVKSRVGRIAAAAGVCLAATTAVTVTGAFASQRPVQAGGHVSAQQVNRQIRALELKGYTPSQCTRQGTLLLNSRTGKTALVSW